jgi:ABC-type xylose transport system substrate-binding protein
MKLGTTSTRSRIMAGVGATIVALGMTMSATPAQAAPGGPIVYFMQPNTTPTRYIQQDGPKFAKELAKLVPGVQVKFVNAGGKSAKQLSQVQQAISAGAKALVIVAADPATSAGMLKYAASKNIPVIGYENPPLNGPLTSQVIFSPKSAGEVQGRYFVSQVNAGKFGSGPVNLVRLYGNKGDVYTTEMLKGQDRYLKPLINSGKINVVCEDYVTAWDPADAQSKMEQCLTRTQNKVSAVLGFYDGITSGAIAAMTAKGVKVPVYGGQNPELIGLQYMLTGQQEDMVMKNFGTEAKVAAQLTAAALKGQRPPKPPVNSSVNNGAANIPTANINVDYFYLIPGVNIGATIDKKVVKQGIFTWSQICTGVAQNTATCKKYNP